VKRKLIHFCLIASLLTLSASAYGQDVRRSLTIWLIPLELADESTTISVDEFNEQVGEGGWVTVLNTTVPRFKDELKAWVPEFANPNFPIIKGQVKTIDALRRFAKQNDVHINVRFVWWGQAFQELQNFSNPEDEDGSNLNPIAPDVAQVGSTWLAYFGQRNVLLPQSQADDGRSWRDVPGVVRAGLRYTTDLRLIFYWKRTSYPSAGQFAIQTDSWNSIIESLQKRAVDPSQRPIPFVMPIVLNYNLLHDYVPLIWSGGGEFLDIPGSRVDLTSDRALTVPKMLAEKSTLIDEKYQWHRLLAFPEISHEEAVHHFWDGEYLAIIEPVGFIKRWREQFAKNGLPKSFTTEQSENHSSSTEQFWDYAGVAVPPRTFVGGSDLIVLRRTRQQQKAFDLARFIASDSDFTNTLAGLGHLPAQLPDHGIDVFCASLEGESTFPNTGNGPNRTAEIAHVLTRTLSQRSQQEYPAIAEWPAVFESQELLEAIQRIWRRIGENDTVALKKVASEAEIIINRNINWAAWFSELLNQNGLIVIGSSIVLLFIAGTLLWLQRKVATQQREKILALLLFQVKEHDQLQAFGDTLHDLPDLWPDELPEKIRSHGLHISVVYSRYLKKAAETLLVEMTTNHAGQTKRVDLEDVVRDAFNGANIEFEAAFAKEPPQLILQEDDTVNLYELGQLPHLAIMILREWFFNSLKKVSTSSQLRPTIEICVVWEEGKPALRIDSPTAISEQERARFLDKPFSGLSSQSNGQAHASRGGGRGIPLMRDLLWYGFRSKAHCKILNGDRTLLSIPLPLIRKVTL
jgi:ABC-type glycerol-3-phosphate transport system substrate-binding protein